VGKQIFFVENKLGGDDLLKAAQFLAEKGGDVGYSNDEDVYFQEKAGNMVLEKGASRVIRESGSLTEAVLPDNTPRNALADTVRFMLTMMNPAQELLIIDPYLFPPSLQQHPDPAYLPYLEMILSATLEKIDRLRIVTKADRHQPTETAFVAMAQAKKAALNIATKYTNDFHDRFWIGDGARGLFVGTSMNGIGKRYSLIDYLRNDDSAEIFARYNALP
jgi:hypothetical protein